MNNIYITGFMSCGKTTVSKILSCISSRELFDTDMVIQEKLGMDINDFFAEHGEEKFRDLETQILIELSKKSNSIISTGGGIVLRQENRTIMKDTGVVVCIMPEFSVIESRLDDARRTRPLLQQDTTKVLELYNERMKYYKDCTFFITPDINTTAEEIAEQINILIDHVLLEG